MFINCSKCGCIIDDDFDYPLQEMVLTKYKQVGRRVETVKTVKMFICKECFEELIDSSNSNGYSW